MDQTKPVLPNTSWTLSGRGSYNHLDFFPKRYLESGSIDSAFGISIAVDGHGFQCHGEMAKKQFGTRSYMIQALRALTNRRSQQYLVFLLTPGLSVKRWLAVGAISAAFITIGIIFALKVSTGPTFISFFESVSLRNEPPYLRGGLFIGLGLIGSLIASFGLFRSLGNARTRTRHWPILDSLYVDKILGSGPNITVIGGGSGLPNLLRGLKRYSSNITAVVTVADDGGSSGRLRNELGILPPGDIRNCLVALADSEDVMQKLMDYRFKSEGQMDGHSFGNILIAALVDIGGDFYRGVEAAGELLAIRGRVIPSTINNVTLVGSTVSGETLIGETRVGNSSDQLRSLTLTPANPSAHPEAVRAIEEADLVVIGPGSLFTSLVPNLLIAGISNTLMESRAFKVYVCNVAEEPAQTEGYSVADHLKVIQHYGGENSVDAVIANDNLPDEPTPAGLKFISADKPWNNNVILIEMDLIDESSTARHDPANLSNAIAEAYRKYRGHRRRLPRVRLNLENPRTATKT